MSTVRSTSYRFDLDGLRGVAIALVVLFHVYVGRVSGGVDVFLLLSGYFFFGSQLRYAARSDASLQPWWPLWRTIRRLYPSLVLVLAATTALILNFLPALGTKDYFAQLKASLLYYQNWELLAQNSDYDAASPDTSSLQHLWSMAVQGQFYVVAIAFALLLAAIRKVSKVADGQKLVFGIAGPVLILVTVASFAYAARDGIIGTPENYYSSFARAWELSLGAVVAIYTRGRHLGPKASTFASGIGLLLILATGFVIRETTAFPGPLALMPLGGAVLLCLSSPANPVSVLLTRGLFRWLGSIAYPLYLWHWPLLILATTYLEQDHPHPLLGTAIIAISLLLAQVTHKWVEIPLAQHRSRPTSTKEAIRTAWINVTGNRPPQYRALGTILIACVCASLFSQQALHKQRVEKEESTPIEVASYPGALALFGKDAPPATPKPDPTLVGSIFPEPGNDGCVVMSDAPTSTLLEYTSEGLPCIYGDTSAEVTVVLAGGSHAEQWMPALNILGQEHGFKVIPMIRQGCPIVSHDTTGVTWECSQWGEVVMAKISEMQPDLVFSSSTRPTDIEGRGPDVVPAGYVGFWERLEWYGVPFFGLRDNPWAFDEKDRPVDLSVCLSRADDPAECQIKRADVYAPTDPAKAYQERFPTSIFVDTSDWFCTKEVCPSVIGNVVVYRDQNHISNAYTKTTTSLIWKYLKEALPAKGSATSTSSNPSSSSNTTNSNTTSPSATSDAVPGASISMEPSTPSQTTRPEAL